MTRASTSLHFAQRENLLRGAMKNEFTLIETFKAKPEEIYRAWLSTDGHTAMTGSPANVDGRVNGQFTAWAGYIWGMFLELKENRRILQTWRTSEFPEDAPDSRLELLLEAVVRLPAQLLEFAPDIPLAVHSPGLFRVIGEAKGREGNFDLGKPAFGGDGRAHIPRPVPVLIHGSTFVGDERIESRGHFGKVVLLP